MRKLLIGALGLSLTGCSHPPPSQTASSPDGSRVSYADRSAADRPLTLASFRTRSAPRATPHHAAKTAKRPSEPTARSTASDASVSKRDSASIPLPRPSPKIARPPTTAEVPKIADPAAGNHAAASPGAGQGARPATGEQVADASADAARANPQQPGSNTDLLVAVVVTRLDVTSISDLTGKTVAIDDWLFSSSGAVRTAIVAAGAPEVQLSEGPTTAIDRLANSETPAAVVALLAPEAAEAYPDITGFRVFRVPLSPRSVKEPR